MIDLNEIATEIRDILDKRREELELTFIEDTHTYYMKDSDGEIKSDFPSVSKVMKYFYEEFDSEGISYRKAKGDTGTTTIIRRMESGWRLLNEYGE